MDVTLQRTITLAGLLERWANKHIGDYKLDFDGIREIIHQTDQLPVYALVRQLEFKGGNRVCCAMQISYFTMMKEVAVSSGCYTVLFNLDDVEKFERDNSIADENNHIAELQATIQQQATSIAKLTGQLAELQASQEELSTKRRYNYLKIILALAEDNQDMALSARGTQTAIVHTLEKMGLKISNTTVGEIIKEAIAFRNQHQE